MLQAIVDGFLYSGVYSALAVGLSLIYGVMRILNIAHPTFAVLAAFLSYWLTSETGLSPLVVLIPIVIFMFGLGMGIERVLIRRLRPDAGLEMMSLLLLFGCGLVVEGILSGIWGGSPRLIPSSFGGTAWTVMGLNIKVTRTVTFVLATGSILIVVVVLARTWFGRALRAVSQDGESAALMGVEASKVRMIAFGIGMALAAVAGTCFGLINAFEPASGLVWIGKVFAVVVLGGMGNVYGAFFAASLLGTAEGVVSHYIPIMWAEGLFYILLVVVLLVRPAGLFGTSSR